MYIAQQPKSVRTIERIDQRLRCHSTDTGLDKRQPHADSKETARGCNAEAAASIAGDDRPGHPADPIRCRSIAFGWRALRVTSPPLHLKSGLPDFGRPFNFPKSETSAFACELPSQRQTP